MSGLYTVSEDKGSSGHSSSSRRISTTTARKLSGTSKPSPTSDDIGLVGASDTADTGNISDTSSSDAAGNTIFILCILAFVGTALGLGFFLWRKHRQNKGLGRKPQGDVGPEGEVDEGKSSIAGIFKRKKDRPTPLPLTNLRPGEDPALPPYSPYTAGAQQSPWMGSGNFTMQGAKAAGINVEGGDDADTKSIRSTRSLSKSRREAAERAGNLFSPFVPFSPVNAHASDNKRSEEEDDSETLAGNAPIGSYRNSYLHTTATLPQASPVRYLDPEAAQAMGIHPEVVRDAVQSPRLSEEEIERRRARAQRRLEERQRAEEGSVVEGAMDEAPRFKQIARERQL